MAGTARQTPTNIEEKLAADPFRFDFFQAVRLLECAARQHPRVGTSLSLSGDYVRFGQAASLSFAPSTIERFEPAANGKAARMVVHFLGLLGPNGPLPAHVTEYARDRQWNNQDSSLVEFLDVLQHRFLSLFYRAWAVNQKAVDFDRPEESRFAYYIGSLFGNGMESLQHRDAVSDWAKLFFSGRLVSSSRNAEGLASILEDYFQMPVEVETFAGRWIDLPEQSQFRMGASPSTGSLGQTICVGSRIWDCQLSFRLRLGPMTFADMKRLLPGEDSFLRLKAWVLNYVGEEFFWDAQVVLKADEVPQTSLGGGSRLGWTTWLKDAPFTKDADNLVLRP